MNDMPNETNTHIKGLLIVTAVNRQTGMKENGTICKDDFNWNSAKLLCGSIGYNFAKWEDMKRHLKNIKNASE